MKKISIKSISQFLKDLANRISLNAKLAFIYTVTSTFFCHIVYFVNRWANEDDFHEIMGQINMIGSGRWMPGTIFSSNFLMPIILLIITMITLGLISMMIISLFKVRKKVYIFIISLLLSSFPVLALGFGYGFMVERYILGMFFAIFAVFITSKLKFGFIFGALSIAITMGYYQSYIAITIGLTMLIIIYKMFENDSYKDNIKFIVKYLVMGIAGVVLYMMIVKVVCHITGIPLLDYKGINKMGALPPLDQMGDLINRTYTNFNDFFFSRKFLHPLWYGRISQLFLYGINLVLLIFAIVKKKIYKKPFNLICLLIFLVLVPLGFNAVDFMAFESEVSSLNIYQFIFILILPFLLLNMLEDDSTTNSKNNNVINVIGWMCSIAALALIWNNFVVTNMYYLKINDYYTTTVQLTNRVYNRIEQMPNFDGSTKVMVGNKKGIYMDRRVYKTYYEVITYDQGLWDQFIGYAPRPTGTDFKFHYLVENIIGVHLYSTTPEKFEEIYNSEEYEKMESWPKTNCMKYIDDILVVKIS